MNKQDILLRDWVALYEAAIKFKDLGCWEWMTDSDLFGVQNPETGEIGYCCVLGQLGEVLALNVYPGSEGLASYWRLHEASRAAMDEGTAMDSGALLGTQLCFMASFEDRSELHQNDLQIIRALGFKFRGKKQWPMFRSYQPGFVPWFLTAPEARFLPVALGQAMEVARRLRDNPDLLDPPDGDTELYFVRVLEGGTWRDRWQRPPPYKARQSLPLLDEVRLARIQRGKFPRRATWHAACTVLPMVIEEGDRPYYPCGFPVLSDEGIALGMDLFKPGEVEHALRDKFLDLVEKLKCLPELLLVASEEAFRLL
ncbi:MAG: hypothetical protein ACE5JU_17285, partial [Candidatus Binatia bacterium]